MGGRAIPEPTHGGRKTRATEPQPHPAEARAATDPAWELVLAASAAAEELERQGRRGLFALDESGCLRPPGGTRATAELEWSPKAGWSSRLPADDPRSALLDLYLPICSASSARPMTVGHLGQSLDGFIATHSGDSQFVTGSENLLHMHRMRALSDAVLVGAGTVAADDPQLTTRHVRGSSPLRVVFDPTRRLTPTYRVFTDQAAPTLYLCARSRIDAGETQVGHAAIVGLDDSGTERDLIQVLELLRARGCARIFVEGGGITVSAFLEANLLDRLQIAIAPVLIGDGKPAIRLTPFDHLRDCLRPGYRVFQMGGDVLFDCDINAQAGPEADPGTARPIVRVI